MLMAVVLATLTLGGTEPGPVSVELLPLKIEAMASMPRGSVQVMQGGESHTYTGTPLMAVLDGRTNPVAGMPGLRDLADAVLLVRGADNYQAAVSAASVAMDPKGERYLLATTRDGQPIPLQLIIPGDPKRARWVKTVVAIRLVRLNQLIKTEP